ncbi:ImmA/IrrE family metallo-endopeptidase [Aestuariimicrobium sp. p3-SID1156]|uniref:ImmA/IrrE family metallo-endopeptidase n=1 Tax=Aestuariimicrobium sp. p3-SID1156 TaxID=2916038 RepID=UPI00223B2B2D|nr:ImmA/IrrE family metallo-endopeptidase [Aestuariimicrobium sp. p3-SID1156]MCT1459369.1 ImmA/IrrE family metallo-endopeptidase [Aestuariimicrobium sp. p3-SID1156]
MTKRVPVLDKAGTPILDKAGEPVKQAQIVATKLVSVFDVSQTSGEPIAEPPSPVLLEGEAPEGLWDRLAELVTARGYTLERGDCGGANGVTIYDTRTVRVRADVDDAQAVKTLAHELGHVLLHEPGAQDEARMFCRGRFEVEAESVAYLVTHAHGLDSGQYTFSYVAGWGRSEVSRTGKTWAEVVAETGSRVIKAAHQILEVTQPDAGEEGAVTAA